MPVPEFDPGEYVSVREAAEQLGVSGQAVRDELERRDLDVFRLGARYCVHRSAFEELRADYRPRRRLGATARA